MRSLKAAKADIGMRADVFMAKYYPEFSRSSLDGLFDGGLVILNSKPVKNAYKIRQGDTFNVNDDILFVQPEAIELPVIYENDDVVVIDKPAGTLTHAKGALNNEATVASFIQPKLDKDMPKSNRAGIVHRLDRMTSGVIITAKNAAALKWLQKQFSSRKTKKNYAAIVEGELEPPEAVINAPIARNPRNPQTFAVYPSGKPAQTEYKATKVFSKNGDMYTLLDLKPLTGRTHQLRVHLAYIKHPIVGDAVYGRAAEHLYLHAKKLELTLPNGERKVFSSTEPAYFKEFQRNV
ncbi:MAG TPA: RluA family pseudouridine synthase [Candidatus Saccharimonadales bacterium]|nr:RluA family pseudouridine synthase [Candidatus Saccharimonadales bacterium]